MYMYFDNGHNKREITLSTLTIFLSIQLNKSHSAYSGQITYEFHLATTGYKELTVVEPILYVLKLEISKTLKIQTLLKGSC